LLAEVDDDQSPTGAHASIRRRGKMLTDSLAPPSDDGK
jgi:hypothetical protein